MLTLHERVSACGYLYEFSSQFILCSGFQWPKFPFYSLSACIYCSSCNKHHKSHMIIICTIPLAHTLTHRLTHMLCITQYIAISHRMQEIHIFWFRGWTFCEMVDVCPFYKVAGLLTLNWSKSMLVAIWNYIHFTELFGPEMNVWVCVDTQTIYDTYI